MTKTKIYILLGFACAAIELRSYEIRYKHISNLIAFFSKYFKIKIRLKLNISLYIHDRILGNTCTIQKLTKFRLQIFTELFFIIINTQYLWNRKVALTTKGVQLKTFVLIRMEPNFARYSLI